MAARTLGAERLKLASTVCVLFVLSCASSESSQQRSVLVDQQDKVQVSYFPSSELNFGFRGELSEAELRQQNLDVVRLKNDLSGAVLSASEVARFWNNLQNGLDHGIRQFRRKRDTTPVSTSVQVPEDRIGKLINFNDKFSNLGGRTFTLNSASAYQEMFEVTSTGELRLSSGNHLDYEVESMRTITFVVHATSNTDSTDVYEITTNLTVTNVDEPPVFETKPQPYLATVRTNTGSGYTIIILVATDPEGADVYHEKVSVSPVQYNDRIELRTETVNGDRQCQLRTAGSGTFNPEGADFTIKVSARDAVSGGQVASTTVRVLIGLRPPQFYQSSYQGAMPEMNKPEQTVYKLDTTEELKMEWKTFQQGDVTLSLTDDTGMEPQDFTFRRGSGNEGYVECKNVLDYETTNSKTQSLTLTAIQSVGNVALTSSVVVTIKIEDKNDNQPIFDQVQYQNTVKENLQVGASVLDVTARDKDTGLNAQIDYELHGTEDFEVVTETVGGDPPVYRGVIRVKSSLDFDRKEGPFYNFQVKAIDRGSPQLTSASDIRITVTNVNDEVPQFVNEPGTVYKVQDSTSVGQFITQIFATDKDGDTVTYTFSGGSGTYQKFSLNRDTGLLTLNAAISDSDDRFTLNVNASDDGSCCSDTEGPSSKFNDTTFYVQVYGTNTERPDFTDCSNYSPSVFENSDPGTSVLTVTAVDNDRGPNGVVTYSLIKTQESARHFFAIDPSSGLITVNGSIDRETTTFIQVTVTAKDGGSPHEEGYCSFTITINDRNDNVPRFDKPQYVANITSEHPILSSFLSVRAYDDDVGNNAIITYSLPDDAEGKFSIIPESGFIYLTEKLSAGTTYSLTAMAQDEGNQPLNSTVRVLVHIQLGNTQPPEWDQDYNRVYEMFETVDPNNNIVIENMGCDSKIPGKPEVEFQLIGEDGSIGTRTDYFTLVVNPFNATEVSVAATGEFDYSVQREHIIRIRCLNFGPVTLLTETNPKVILIDTNNKAPQFVGTDDLGRYVASVQENKPAGTSVITVEATDQDATSRYNNVSFEITSGGDSFTITQGQKSNTAVIKTKDEFDRESVDTYYVTVKAQDGAPSSLPGTDGSPNSETVVVKITITDMNDNIPHFSQSLYHIRVNESQYINDLIEPAITVDDDDQIDQGRHRYRIVSGNGIVPTFGVRNGLGNLFLLRKLDYETGDKSFLLVLEARDSLYSASTTVSVTVNDDNDNSPVFTSNAYFVEDIVENDNNVPRPLLTVTAIDADVDRNKVYNISYSLEGSSFTVSEFFSIDEYSGELSVLKPLDRDPPQGRPKYLFTVKAADEKNNNPNYGYAQVSVKPLDVNDNKPEFLTDPLEAEVDENSEKGASVIIIQATDRDNGDNGTVMFFITNIVDGANVERPDYFRIEENSGFVTTNTNASNLDRETEDTYYVTILLKDKGTPQQQTSGVLTVKLSDRNDMPPVFQQKIYRTEMTENMRSGEVIRVIAVDGDIGPNAQIHYILTGQGDTRFFSVISVDNQGSVQILSAVDYEDPNQRFFNLTVKAEDNARNFDICYVEITVLDFNDNPPQITPTSPVRNVSEDAPTGTLIATFSATDADASDINKAFEFSISRASDPRRHFSIDPKTGQVKVRRKLDRETTAVHELIILAIDKGSPALTGATTLTVTVDDVNDNYPTFLEDYHPHVLEGKDAGVKRTVQEVFAKDPDAAPHGAPFGFRPGPCSDNICELFSFRVDDNAAGGNGSFTVLTDREFDREAKKYYLIPIVMWDMRGSGSQDAMTGTNTLTVTIADINDNDMMPGTQNMFVYNYKGMFGPVEIGRTYVEDADDWDLSDKTFTFKEPKWMESYFSVATDTGMVTMSKGVPSNAGKSPYTFTVTVLDRKFRTMVVSTVSVMVEDLSEEAVRNSGATRLKGTSAEAFIKMPKSTADNPTRKSSYEKFREKLAQKLNTDKENVQIISVQDVEGGYTDVRYSVHGSPYYPASQSDSIVALNKDEFERDLSVSIEEVPIDACVEEVFEGGCYNYMDITGRPSLVNSNGTSFVGVEVFIKAMEGCRALDFPEPVECSGDYCYHGGTCIKNDFGVLSCRCPEGFDGPRCQQLRHTFDGNSFAMYPTLEQCENSETSIEFKTTQRDSLLLYNGPATPPVGDKPKDFIALQLTGGMPMLTIDHGSGSVSLLLDGKDSSDQEVIRSLADGKWHKIDIVRKGKFVEMIVDDCIAAGPFGSDSQPPDTRPCRATANTPGENSFLNVATLLQVGGRAPGHTYPPSKVVNWTGFYGCVRNLVHNRKYYDLHYKKTPSVPSGKNGCPDKCNTPCSKNGVCVAPINSQQGTCLCNPGWRGTKCTEATMIRDLQTDSFVEWQVKTNAQLPSYELEVQVMYRTWDTDGVLFTVSSQDNRKRVTMELKDGRLQVLYNLDNKDNTMKLSNARASDGYWHVARFKRVMHYAILTLDAGEGRNQVSQRDQNDKVYMQVNSSTPLYSGASVTDPKEAQVLDRDLTNTCIQDVRLNGAYLPIKGGENSVAATVAQWVYDKNMVDGCTRPDGCVPPPTCPLNSVCVNIWGHHLCRCAPGFHGPDNGVCESDCKPNPCFQNVPCWINNGSTECNCTIPNWTGPLCNVYVTEEEEPSIGIATASIVAIVVSILLVIILVLLAFFLVNHYMRKKNKDEFDKFIVEEDADFDIRENVIFYDEEGAGEEDQNAFDLTKLPTPASETTRPPNEMVPRRTELQRGRRAPDDRPDVGDVLHDRLGDAEDDPDAPPHDTLITFNEEGAGSDAGSLSSLGSSSSDGSQDYDYLNDWGPKFAKLADMYGAGQE